MADQSNFVREKVTGYEAFKKRIQELATQDKLFVLFTGSKNEDGTSWCPDCNEFEEVLQSFKDKFSPTAFLLTVDVGDRDTWKSPQSPFRTDRALRLTSIPTLMMWGTPKVLNEDAILKEDNLSMLFLDDDD